LLHESGQVMKVFLAQLKTDLQTHLQLLVQQSWLTRDPASVQE
jgi:hypothetical protein